MSTNGQPSITQLNLGQAVNRVDINKRGEYRYYKIKIPNNYDANDDLIIKAIPLDPDSDPDIYISKTNQYPNSSSTSDWQCAAYGRDACQILHRNISKSDTFYVGMTCVTVPCQFSVLAMMSDEFVLEDGVEFQTYMTKQEAKVFKYHVQGSTTENQTIMIKASAYSGSAKAFNIRVQRLENDESDKYQNTHSKLGQPAWKKGQVVRISSSDNYLWCTDCYLTIVLDVQDEGYYHLMASTTGVAPLVYNGIQVNDMVGYGERQCYQYYVKSEETDLQITLTTYSGRVNITANPNDLPNRQEDFLFKPDFDETSSILDLNKWARKNRAQQPKGLYYICAYGQYTSTYTLKVREFEVDYQKIYVEDGYSERFFIPSQGFQILMYEVPKLEYTGEDIKIEATLKTMRATKPVFAGQMCGSTDPEECRSNVTKAQVNAKDSKFIKALDKGHMLQLVMDHNETRCNQEFKGECYYALVVQNPHDHPIRYEITVSHSQNNHILLQEGTPYMDSVDLGNFKYYKFSTLDTDIQNITFQISPLHGDSDIYVSRGEAFPNKTNWERRGARAGSNSDHVAYKLSEDGPLNSTYYIGIYGYTYASYSLVVNVIRSGKQVEQAVKASQNALYEGVPFKKTLHNELDMFIGYFEVDISEDDNSSILISIAHTQGKSHMYVKYMEVASPLNSDYETVDGIIKIKPGQRAYHKKGMYFVTVVPKFGFWEFFTDDYYTFTVTWRIENSLAYLSQHEQLNFHVPSREYRYVKHYVAQVDSSIKITYTNGGQSDLYVSIDPNNKQPTEQHTDFSTKYIYGGNYTNIKSLYIPSLLLQMKNPACVDLGYAYDEPCVINIGVYCNQGSECKGQFSVEYESVAPTLIHAGQSKHSNIQPDSWIYYYLTVPQSSISDIYAVLTPLAGDLDLYLTFQRDFESFSDWTLPTQTTYDLKSLNKLKTEMIQITNEDLQQCFVNNQTMNDNCIIVFGIYAHPTNSLNQTGLMFNFVTYKNIIEIKDRSPMSAYVQDQQMTYFLYYESCTNCTMIISLSSYSSGDPDLYIVKGDRLPTVNDYDIKKATIHSEVVVLNLDSEYYINNNISSLEGYYTIGVFGNKNTSFILSVQSQDYPITDLTEGIQIMQYQKPYEVSFYQFYNWYDKDIQIQTLVQKGYVDVLVNTYYQQNPDQNFLELLPQSQRYVKGWSIIDVNNQNSHEGKELLIMRDDRRYCTDCYYLIGIITHEESARFNILIKATDAYKSYSHLLKIGETKNMKLNETNNVQVYQFLLENKTPASIVPTVITGQVKITLSFGMNKELPIAELTNGKAFTIKDMNLKTDTNYYLTVECLSDKAELTIVVQQKSSVITLQDGVPQVLEYSDSQDVSKYMIFDVVKGSSTVMINVKSKTNGFFPELAYSVFHGDEANDLLFPTMDINVNQIISSWDKDMYLMKATLNFENLPEDAGLALNLYYRNSRYNFISSASAIITVSNAQIVKLIPDEEYFSEFKETGAQFNAFKVDPPREKNMVIEFSQCTGLPYFFVITNVTDLSTKVKGEQFQQKGMQVVVFPKQNKPYYVIVEPLEKGVLGLGRSEYTIKVKYQSQSDMLMNKNYIASNDGHIEVEFQKGRRGEFKLKWGPLYEHKEGSLKPLEDVRYQIVKSTVTNARMDSVCAIKRSSSTFQMVTELKGTNEATMHKIKPGEETYFNIIAIQDDKQIQYPYQPITVSVPARMSIGGRWAIYISACLIVVFVYLACFFYKKSQKLQRQLQFEVNEVQNTDGDVERYRRVGANSNYGQLGEEKDDE